MRALMRYLTRDCCGGNPAICADLIPIVGDVKCPVGVDAGERIE